MPPSSIDDALRSLQRDLPFNPILAQALATLTLHLLYLQSTGDDINLLKVVQELDAIVVRIGFEGDQFPFSKDDDFNYSLEQ